MLLLVAAIAPLRAQESRPLTTDARLHKAPGGAVVGSLVAGAAVTPGQVRGRWIEVAVDGWMPSRSVAAATQQGFDLAVSARGGESIARTAAGAPMGRLRSGALLHKVEENSGWTHVRRSGWLSAAALAAGAGTPAPVAGAPAATVAPGLAAADGDRVEAARAAQVYAVPDGGPMGTIQPGTSGRVLGRSGEWVRMQLEGWVREGDLTAASGGALVGVSAAEVRASPERYIGQTVEWRVQLIALQVADQLRPELPAGQPYLLTRGPLPEPGFVYVIVKSGQLARFRALPPLAELSLRVIIRAAHTRYLATPVVELVSIVEPSATATQ